MSTEDAKQILICGDFNPRLFPNNVFIVNYEPFRLQPENLDIALPSEITILMTFDARNKQLVAVSFSSLLMVKLGFRIDVDFYGADIEILMEHINKQLENRCKHVIKSRKDCHILIHFPKSISVDRVEERMHMFGVLKESVLSNTYVDHLEYVPTEECLTIFESEIEEKDDKSKTSKL